MLGLTHASTIPRVVEGTRPCWRVPSTLRSFARNGGAVVGTAVLVGWLVAAIFAPFVAPYDPLDPVGVGRSAPSAEFWFGTDLLGRDIFSRVIYGARISLGLGVISVGIGLTLGVLMGLPAGYYGRWVDTVVMRVIDAMLAFPGLLLALLVIASLGPGLQNVMLAVGISSIPIYARLVRGICLTARELDYVSAARVVGSSDMRIMARHILPNLAGPLIVLSTLQIGAAILIGSSLSYLGMGAQPPTPEWGLMTADGRSYLARQWWMSTFPGLAIFSVVMAVNLMGDGLRPALDPRTRRR